MGILESIYGHEDLRCLNDEERNTLCKEIRAFLISHIAKTGGHLASNLGVVELTVAIETVFNTAKDRLVFDVGHQSYVHKLLTGRQTGFDCLRQYGGMAGFPKPSESETDAFTAGHSSSSVSIALGMARARTLMHQDYHVVTLLGDGAATGGMVYEGMNDAAESNEPMVVILNDNEMSIDRNVGGIAQHLSRLRTKEAYLGIKQRYKDLIEKLPGGNVLYKSSRYVKDHLKRALIPTTIFENMGMTYLGPVDGHNVKELISVLSSARDMMRPVVIHVLTQKGHGYTPAEENPMQFHGVGKFEPKTGKTVLGKSKSFSDAFGETMCYLAAADSRVCAVTAAMPGGTGLLQFKNKYPKRLFDVGIAEEHAVSMACGLAKQGLVPVVALYSTFMQRAYDQILQDIGIQKLHVVLAVDRAGLVGEDGETHHGVFDIGFLRQVPGMQILCPSSRKELSDMLSWAVLEQDGPVAIRYPRGGDRCYVESDWSEPWNASKDGLLKCHRFGKDVMIVTYGSLLQNALEAAELLAHSGVEATVLRLMTLAPLPIQQILDHWNPGVPVVVVEETCVGSGIWEPLSCGLHLRTPGMSVLGMNLGADYVTHGDIPSLYRHCKLDAQSIRDYILEVIPDEN